MRECDRHRETVVRARAGEPDGHLAECGRCRDTRLVADALGHLASDASRLPPPAADARALLRRWRFLERLQGEQRTAERSARPLAFARVIGLAVMAGVIGWTILGGTSVGASAGGPSSASGLLYALSRLAAWPLAVGALAALATARFLWVED